MTQVQSITQRPFEYRKRQEGVRYAHCGVVALATVGLFAARMRWYQTLGLAAGTSVLVEVVRWYVGRPPVIDTIEMKPIPIEERRGSADVVYSDKLPMCWFGVKGAANDNSIFEQLQRGPTPRSQLSCPLKGYSAVRLKNHAIVKAECGRVYLWHPEQQVLNLVELDRNGEAFVSLDDGDKLIVSDEQLPLLSAGLEKTLTGLPVNGASCFVI